VDDQNSHMLQIAPSGDSVKKIWNISLRNLSGSAIYTGGNLYVSGSRRMKGYFNLDPKTGKARGSVPKPLTAAGLWADGRLYLQSDEGIVLLLKPTASGFEKCGEFPVVPRAKRKDVWAHPVVFDGRLYLRYHDTLFCYDVKAR